MSRRPLVLGKVLAALACAGPLLAPTPVLADTCNGLSLLAQPPAGAGDTPVAVAAGDFNRDGRLDVATANYAGNDVSVLLRNGSGGFDPPTSVGTWAGSNPVDIVAGDIDRDGFLDLVVASPALTQARVLRGTPGGGFSPASAFGVGFAPSRLYLADFTRDGKLDLVVVSNAANRVLLFEGNGTLGFSTLLAMIDVSLPAPPERPVAVASGDFNRDGNLDLAVAYEASSEVSLHFGNGGNSIGPIFAWTPGPLISLAGLSGPRDIAAGDVDRDGWLDLVTANHGTGDASVLRNNGGLAFTQSMAAVGGAPSRLALLDLNRDGILDIAALDDATPRMVGVLGLKTGPPYFQATPLYPENLPSMPSGLAFGPFTADGRVDLVTALSGPRQVVEVDNGSGMPCAGTSFGRAPRAYAAGDGPSSTAAADLDGDGHSDLAVAAQNSMKVLLLQNVAGHFAEFSPSTSVDVSPAVPTAVASADLDSDGKPDVVAALSGSNVVRVFRGNGSGGLIPGGAQAVGPNPSALVIGDFDGNGIPDVAATSDTSGLVYLYRGDGLGGLAPGLTTAVGAGPRALVAGYFNSADTFLDLAVANSTGDSVSILLGNGNGTFTPAVGSPLSLGAGTGPEGIAAGDIDGDTDLDLVTANNVSGTVSVLHNDGAGAFTLIVAYPVQSFPTAVALLDLAGDTKPDLVVTSSGPRTLAVLTNTGGIFGSPTEYPVRNLPRAITQIDADSDGRLDLVVPCQNADSLVVFLARTPGPPLLEATRVGVGTTPRGLVAADLDGDGDLDLAVAAFGDDSVTLRRNDGNGVFTPFATASYAVGGDPESIVAADFNRDGRIDLALNGPGATPTPVVSILLASGAPGEFTSQFLLLPGVVPDDLAVGDFDRDGDIDIAVCDKQVSGAVTILRNDGSGVFSIGPSVTGVGDKPTSIVAGDFDRDGDLDLAVGNDFTASNVRILTGDGLGGFTLGALLPLDGSDKSPLSLAAADFDGDGTLDLAAAAFFVDRIHVYRNLGGGTFGAPVPFTVPAALQFVTTADLNLDGRPDLAAVSGGLVALRGKGGLDFEPVETWMAGVLAQAAVIADFNGDGRPDAAVVNAGSADASVLLSTTCTPRRLDVAQQPLACGASPYSVVVEARDDGGNLAYCATGSVKPSIVPGTGTPGADLGPDILEANGLALSNGVASFTGPNALTINLPGRRYRLRFSLEDTPPPNLPPALSRSFTLGSEAIQILGQASFCAPGSASYGITPPLDRWDSFAWTLDSAPVAFTPIAQLENPTNPLVTPGAHSLGLTTRVDGCSATATPFSLFVGDLQSVTLDVLGASTVCVDCIGGSAKAIETGGGSAARQWGYRTTSTTGAITPLVGETGDTYVLKGASFPGAGPYYVVVTTSPACGLSAVSNEWAVTVVPSVPSGEVLHLAASSRGNSTSGQNRLLWVNTTGLIEEVKIRWDAAPAGTTACLPPANLAAPFDGEATITTPAPGMTDDFLHSGLLLDTAYCYSVFVKVSGAYSPGRTVKARPFDSTAGPVKWAYATGGTAVAPPTVSGEGILAMSNDRTVHSLTRGSAGGEWPASWVPTALTGVAHSRSPVVPFTVPLNGANTVLFTADDMGFLYSIDAKTGVPPWSPQGPSLSMTGAPGGIFTQYGGIRDALFVGTRDNSVDNAMRALNLATGAFLEAYGPSTAPGPIGPINGTPAIDYGTRRIYFASHKRLTGDTLFCLEIGATSPVFTYVWSRDLGNITGSPVLRGGRVYVGNDSGIVYSINAVDGGIPVNDDHIYTPAPADGPVKGFLFPDRRNDDLIFATETKVWSISDDGSAMTLNWQWTTAGLNPSVILYWPKTSFVYVGSANGTLYQLDFSFPTVHPSFAKPVILGGGFGQVGAPSLDIGVPEMLLVGSEPGVIYGLLVPF